MPRSDSATSPSRKRAGNTAETRPRQSSFKDELWYARAAQRMSATRRGAADALPALEAQDSRWTLRISTIPEL